MSIDVARLRRLDLNLLLAFSVLMREGSVSRAAQKLYVGQPAMSGALARLRTAFADELFVRTGRSLVPTARARALAQAVDAALEALGAALYDHRPFDPARHQGTFRIGLTDNQEITLLPAVAARLHRDAPGAALVSRPSDYSALASLLDAGEIDVAVSIAGEPAAWHVRESLFEQGYACLYSRRHVPLRGPISLARFCALPHVLVSFRGDLSGAVDQALAALQRKRRVAIAVPRFAVVPHLLAGAPLLATVPEPIARRFASLHRLGLSPLPLRVEPRSVAMTWRRRDENDPAQAWFRGVVREAAGAPATSAR